MISVKNNGQVKSNRVGRGVASSSANESVAHFAMKCAMGAWIVLGLTPVAVILYYMG